MVVFDSLLHNEGKWKKLEGELAFYPRCKKSYISMTYHKEPKKRLLFTGVSSIIE